MTQFIRRRPANYRVTFAVLCVGVASFAILQSMVNPVLPTVQAELHTDQATVTWVLTANLLSASVFTPIIGRVGDKVGKDRMLVVALAALAVGSLVAALATSIGILIAARAIQGVGGGVLPLTFGIIRDEFPREKVTGAIGAASALLAGGSGVGLVIAGPVVNAFGYRWLFWLPMIVTTLATVAAARYIPKSPELRSGRINIWTSFLLSGWLIALLVGVSQGPSWGWSSASILGLLVAAGFLLPLWMTVESRSSSPLVDMKMMRIRTVWSVNLVALLFGAALYSMYIFLPQFVQTSASVAGYGFDASIGESGLLMLPMTTASFVAGLLSGVIATRWGSKFMLVASAALSTLGLLGLAILHQSMVMTVVVTTVLGFAFGLAFAATANLVVQAVPQSQTGVAGGMNANIRTVGGALGCAVLAAVITSSPGPSGLATESAYVGGFLLLAATSAIATVVALLVPAARRRSHLGSGEQQDSGEQQKEVVPDMYDRRQTADSSVAAEGPAEH